MNLLLVEDDRSIGTFLRRGVESAGHALDGTMKGREAIRFPRFF